jgi:hypothetical protein
MQTSSLQRNIYHQSGISADRVIEKSETDSDGGGVVELDSAGNRLPGSGMVDFHVLVRRLLPASHLEFPSEKVSDYLLRSITFILNLTHDQLQGFIFDFGGGC